MRYVLAAFDGSSSSHGAVFLAGDMAERHGARLHVLVVARLPLVGLDVCFDDSIIEEEIQRTAYLLEALRQQVPERFHHAQLSLRVGEPAREIARYALEYGAKQIFVGGSWWAMPRFLSIGVRIRRLLAGTDCEVTIVGPAHAGSANGWSTDR
jgi:Osmosensitive K+ channel histidine kinase